MLSEVITHRPLFDIRESRSITNRNSFAVVERTRGSSALVFLVFVVFANEFT